MRLATTSDREANVRTRLQTLFSDLSGLERVKLDVTANFTELGFDSLFLTQVTTAIQKMFNLKVSFRQLIEDFSTIESLAAYLDRMMPPDQNPVVA